MELKSQDIGRTITKGNYLASLASLASFAYIYPKKGKRVLTPFALWCVMLYVAYSATELLARS